MKKTFTRNVSVDMEEIIKFRESSASGSRFRTFCKILQHCDIGNFSTVWLMSLKKIDEIFLKILSYVHLSTRNPHVKLWNQIIRFQICIGFALAEVFALQVLLFFFESENFLFAVCTCIIILHVFKQTH